MIASRNVDDLHPFVADLAKKHIVLCDKEGIDLVLTSTYRDKESQNALYASGRSIPGPKKTNAKGGSSFHNYKLAYDFCVIVNGKADYDTLSLYKKVGDLGKTLGLEWAGDWVSFKENCHMQYTGGLTIKELLAGCTLDCNGHKVVK